MRITVILSLICFPFQLLAQNKTGLKTKADILFQKKDFANAASLYRKAASLDTKDATAYYNLGIAEFKAENFENSLLAFKISINISTDVNFRAKAMYNLGLALLKSKETREAIQAFKSSLIINPLDNQCRQNLQIVLNELKKENENNKSDNTGKKDNDNSSNKEEKKEKKKQDPMNKKSANEILNTLQAQEQKLRDSITRSSKKSKHYISKDW